MYRIKSLLTIICLMATPLIAQELTVQREFDGDYSFRIYRTTINEGSELKKEAIIINDPTSPINLLNQSFSVEYEERTFYWNGTTGAQITSDISGFKVTHIVYDAFGQHLKSLSNTEVKEFTTNDVKTFEASWRASDSYATNMLTHVTFVSRVRFSDGTQWVYDSIGINDAIANLNLEEIADLDYEE